MHVSLFSVRHLFLDLFGFIEVSSLWQMSPLRLPHYHTIFQSKNGEYEYWFTKSNLVYQACPIYWPLSQFTADASPTPTLCHTQCHQRPPAFTPLTKWRCLFTANRRKIQLLFNDNPEIEAAINTGKYTFWQISTYLKKKSLIWVILTQFSNSCEIKFANSSWRWRAG